MRTAEESFYFTAEDGERIFAQSWLTDSPRALIQIAHGLGETAEYYREFAQQAVRRGFNVYVNEARGHGRTAGDVRSPDYRKKAGTVDGGMDGIVDDLHRMSGIAREQSGALPLFLLGHSMGAVAAQLYAVRYGGELAGMVLTGVVSGLDTARLLKAADGEIAARGPHASSRDVFQMLFGGLNRPFEPVKTAVDWITGDAELAAETMALPYTSVLFDNAFYRSFLQAVQTTQAAEFASRLPKKLPILLLGGGEDVMADRGGSVCRLYESCGRAGMADREFHIYEGQRHSILRDTGRARTMEDILAWMEKRRDDGRSAG